MITSLLSIAQGAATSAEFTIPAGVVDRVFLVDADGDGVPFRSEATVQRKGSCNQFQSEAWLDFWHPSAEIQGPGTFRVVRGAGVAVGVDRDSGTSSALLVGGDGLTLGGQALTASQQSQARDGIGLGDEALSGIVSRSEQAAAAAELSAAAADVSEANALGHAQSAFTSAVTAATNAKNYFTTSAALADADLIVGTQFSVINGLQLDFYRKDTGPVATYLYSVPSADFVSGQVGTLTVGHLPTAAGTLSGTSIFYWPGTLKPYPQRLKTIEIGTATAQTGTLVVAVVEGDGTLTLVSRQEVVVGAGAVSVTGLDVVVPVGCVVGFGGIQMYYEVSSGTVWSTAAVPTSSTAKTIGSVNMPRLRFSLTGETKRDAEEAKRLAQQLGAEVSRGFAAPVVGTGTTVPSNYTIFDPRPATEAGYITSVTIGAAAASTMKVLVAEITAAGVATIISSTDVALVARAEVYPVRIAVASGQYVGVANGYRYQPFSNPDGIKVWLKSGTVTSGDTLTANASHRYEVQFEIKSGALADIEQLSQSSAGNSGLALMAAADATGMTDATAILTAARAAHAQPYIPPGLFAVTALPSGGSGLWGPGRLVLNGERYYLNPNPRASNLQAAFRAAMQRHLSAGDVLTLIGDSISHFAYSGTGPGHWFNRLTRFANAGIAKDEPVMTALRPSSTYTPDFYGLTTTGTVSTGTNGPLGESLVLASGAVMTFTGAYETVGVFYTQGAGAGSLAFQYNGGSAFGTTNAADSTELDKYAGHATGQTGSGTYTITSSGGSVEITGLVRLGVKTAGTPPRLLTSRCAHGSYLFSSFGSVQRAAIVKQAQAFGGRVVPIIALGINDSFGTAAATILSNAQALIDALQAAGADVIYAVPPIRPSAAWDASYTGGRTFDMMAGPLMNLYRSEGVKVLPIDALDWINSGELQDGLHPGAVAQDRIAQLAIEEMAITR